MAIVKRPPRRRPSAAPTGDAATTYSASSQLRADLGPRIDGRYGSYQLLAKVGSGVFDDVYRAKDIRTGEIVAVKIIGRTLERACHHPRGQGGLYMASTRRGVHGAYAA
ncbi:hypothetical protein GUJ93_ZPchr0006g41575 [Zizania palustris]|uniref:Protein kinase domain-containing protein n=1 Tax=Zizania palustris TaxID=103762 RepID=A0A8J5S696_ZIZPA|nr:hypothetical protein GUJ93_ZPchr0006g41575 [Zizania palustris]